MWTDAKSIFQQGLTVFHDQWLKMISVRFASESAADVKRLLEEHTRAFIMDKLMASLNWSQTANGGGHQNLLTEAFYTSAKAKETTLFLDYFGYDAVKDLPLLVLESKRLGAPPPKSLVRLYLENKSTAQIGSTAEALALAFNDSSWLAGDWKKHQTQLRNYYDAIMKDHGIPPAVMAIGNGEWLVVIRDPKKVFSGQAESVDFFVVEPLDREKIGEAYVRHFREIHDLLEFTLLLRTARGVPPERLPARIRQATQLEVMRGVRVGYSKLPKLKTGTHPRLEIEPVAFVRTPGTPWLLVEVDAGGEELPHVQAQL